jgi:hypothetical protein
MVIGERDRSLSFCFVLLPFGWVYVLWFGFFLFWWFWWLWWFLGCDAVLCCMKVWCCYWENSGLDVGDCDFSVAHSSLSLMLWSLIYRPNWYIGLTGQKPPPDKRVLLLLKKKRKWNWEKERGRGMLLSKLSFFSSDFCVVNNNNNNNNKKKKKIGERVGRFFRFVLYIIIM